MSKTPDPPPTATVTTGDPIDLERALARVADLGTVTASGSPLAGDATIDLYADLHVRGLTLVLVPPEEE